MARTLVKSAFLSLFILGALAALVEAQSYDSLKAALANPKKATALTLKDTDARLKRLPPEIKKLKNLQRLQIICLTQLETLPPEIRGLTKLERLVIDNGNRCRMNISLPEAIGSLTNLRVLRLSGVLGNGEGDASKQPARKNAGLPDGISRLKNLTELDLGRNGLTAVPRQITGLDKLERLVLDDNNISEIPAFVPKLKSLRELSLVSTNVTALPDEFKKTKGLKIAIGGNNLTPADLEALKKDFPNVKFAHAGSQANPAAAAVRSPEKKQGNHGIPNYRAIFTNGLDENNEPLNNLKEVSMEEKSIYLYVMWYSLPRENHQYVCNIYDGAGDLVRQTRMDFSPVEDTHYTYTSYQIRRNVDSPGEWKFEIFLNGVKVIDRHITVASR